MPPTDVEVAATTVNRQWVLGMTGFTSYLGLVDIGQPKKGETVLVSGAAGGAGSNVGWIARNLGKQIVRVDPAAR